MKKYLPKNGNIIVIQKMTEQKTASGIILAQEARHTQREAEVLATDSEVAKVGDVVIFDYSSGSYLEENSEGSILAIPESEIVAVVEKD